MTYFPEEWDLVFLTFSKESLSSFGFLPKSDSEKIWMQIVYLGGDLKRHSEGVVRWDRKGRKVIQGYINEGRPWLFEKLERTLELPHQQARKLRYLPTNSFSSSLLMLLHFRPAQCWEKHAPKVRECTQARDTDSPPHVLELSETKRQRRPKGYVRV